MNALSGVIIWEDWRVVHSWTGYGSVFVLLLLGVYLLAAVDIFEHYDSLVDAGHVQELGVDGGPEYQPVQTTEIEAPTMESKYGAVSGSPAPANGAPTTHKHKVFYRHKPWHMFKE